VGTEDEVADDEPLPERIQRITSLIEDDFVASAELESTIRSILGEYLDD